MFRALVSSGKARIVAVTLSVAVAALLLGQADGPTRASHAGGMDAMTIDMDPSATPANTATSIGSIQSCARINENGMMDADEDGIDTLTVDVLADNIPSDAPMNVYMYHLGYSAGNVSVQFQIIGLLTTAPSSSVSNFSDALPHTTGSWLSFSVDDGPFPGSYESGSGFLDRLSISSEAGAVAGNYALTLSNAGHEDGLDFYPPDAINNATVAINQPCAGGGATPTPTATATATATPTPTATATPTATPGGGDADGDGVPDASDNCPNWPNLGQGYPPWPVPPAGDPDCDGFTSAKETAIGTLPMLQCGVGAWPVDFDDTALIDISDVLTLKPDFGGAVPPALARRDIDPSGLIDISDVLSIKPFYGASC